MSNKLFTGIWGSLLALLMVGIITLNVVLLKYSSLITRSLGHQTVATVNLDTSGDSDYFKSARIKQQNAIAYHWQSWSIRRTVSTSNAMHAFGSAVCLHS